MQTLEYDNIYGCLVSQPLLINCINLVFLMYLPWENDETKIKSVNEILVTIGYFPILIISIFIMLSFNLVIAIPYFYFYNFLQIIKYTKNRKLRIIMSLRWLLTGFYVMIK